MVCRLALILSTMGCVTFTHFTSPPTRLPKRTQLSVSSMRDQVNQLLRAATRIIVGVTSAAVLGCGGDDAGTVNVAPTQIEIVVQPQNQTVAPGSTATFSVQFSGQPGAFNWIKGGDDIPGATSLTYTTPPAAPSDDGLTYGVRWMPGSTSRFPVLLYSTMATLTVVPGVPAVPGAFNGTGNMVMPRAGHRATLLPNGKVLIVGGQSPDLSGPPTAAIATSAEIYDPATATFAATGSMSGARSTGHTVTLLSDGRVLVCGGQDVGSSGDRERADAEIYDPVTGRFTPTGSMGTRRAYHVAVLLGNGRVLVAGGFNNAALSAELFDPATGRFSPTSSMTHYRYGAAAGVLLGDGRTLVFGYDDVGELYDPVQSVFSATGSAQATGGLWLGPSLAMLADGRVLAVGGQEPGPAPSNLRLVANARVFDPATSSFTPTGALIWPRDGATATRLPDGRVLVFGGYGDGRWPHRGELYDPRTGLFDATVSAGAGRVGHTATLLRTGKVLIAGGQAGTSRLATSSPASSLLFDPM